MVIIGKADAKLFQGAMAKAEKGGEIELGFNFQLLKVKDKAMIRFIMQVDDEKSYDALIRSYHYQKKLKNELEV